MWHPYCEWQIIFELSPFWNQLFINDKEFFIWTEFLYVRWVYPSIILPFSDFYQYPLELTNILLKLLFYNMPHLLQYSQKLWHLSLYLYKHRYCQYISTYDILFFIHFILSCNYWLIYCFLWNMRFYSILVINSIVIITTIIKCSEICGPPCRKYAIPAIIHVGVTYSRRDTNFWLSSRFEFWLKI